MSITGNIYGSIAYYNHLRGKLDVAERYYLKMTKYGCSDPKMVAAYGLIQMRKGQFKEAVESFNQARGMNPSAEMRTKIRLNRAVAYYKLGDLERALKALEDIRETVGVSERLYETLGYLYIVQGDLDRALAFNLEAYEYEDSNHAILDNLGQTYMMMDDWSNARLYCEKALAEKPDQVDILYHMAQIELHDGNREQARRYAEKAGQAPRTALNDVTDEMLAQLKAQLAEA